jgi:hypothetical protein
MTPTNCRPSWLTILSLVLVGGLLLTRSGVSAERPLERVDQSSADEHALWLGQSILAIAAAIRSPESPDAMDAVLALGLDSRYYVLVRGWLSMQLAGDIDIMEARNGDVSPQLAARVAFLRKAIRAIDLE